MKNTEEKNKHHYCVILAGGRGKRLWPLSREEKPKQFIDVFDIGCSLLQLTYRRFSRLVPKENIYVTTLSDYRDIVMEQLPELSQDQLLVEPLSRGTAPVVAWATHRIKMRDSEGIMVVTPADQLIEGIEAFEQDLNAAFEHVEDHHCLLTMGIRPTRPEPGYGYIQMGDVSGDGVYEVQSFTEKPERDFAEMFLKSGEFLWNTGLFITTVPYAVEVFSQLLPSVMRSFDENYDLCYSLWKEEGLWVERNYTKYPNISLELGILEKADKVCVRECTFRWTDVGTWHGLFENFSSTSRDNVNIGKTQTFADESHGNIIRLENGRKLVVQGLENYIIAEHGDTLMIIPRTDSSALLRKLLNRMTE